MPSFNAVNYGIRPNKAVERKIVFSGLKKLSYITDLAEYRYVGLGSLWFVDFLMAHKVLGINSMVSIEKNPMGYKRAQFNQPLSCIEVIRGESTLVIPELDWNAAPALVWFDYDTSISGPALADIGRIVPRCLSNSVLIVTVNAKIDELPDKDVNDRPLNSEESLRILAGDLVPNPLSSKSLQRSNYPKLLCEILANQFQAATVKSGRSESFIKLFDITYSDSTPMSTVGGIIATSDKVEQIQQLVSLPEWEGIQEKMISIPPLTMKEKLTLDRLMPSTTPPTPQDMKKLGFELKPEQIEMYHRIYMHYPIFGEYF